MIPDDRLSSAIDKLSSAASSLSIFKVWVAMSSWMKVSVKDYHNNLFNKIPTRFNVMEILILFAQFT